MGNQPPSNVNNDARTTRIGGAEEPRTNHLDSADDAELGAHRAASAPAEIGRYRIERVLGEGGMGVVYLASDTRLERRVALKLLPPSIAGSQERLARFEREARAASTLNHPNIITVHEFGEAEGVHFLVSEYVDGRTLRSLLENGPFPFERALDVCAQVAAALEAAHNSGIVHRDIKPENVMVRADGIVKVLDFGIAKVERVLPRAEDSSPEDETMHMFATAPGAILGTTHYMSPEQARGLPTDGRSDIWSLGVVLYEMLAGRRPFDGPTAADTVVGILSRDPEPVSLKVENVPPAFDAVIGKMLARDLSVRYGNASDLRADLEGMRRNPSYEVRVAAASGDAAAAAAVAEMADHHATHDAKPRRTLFQSTAPEAGTSIAAIAPRRVGIGISLAFGALVLVALAAAAYIFYAPAASRPVDSIAVLPFENSSADPALTSIADGLSETLLDRLAELPQVRVISRSSSFQFRGPSINPKEVAAKLGVRAIVLGSVTREGDELVVRIEAIDAQNDAHLAGFQVRQKQSDVPRLQNEIAQLAASRLELRLSDAQSKRLVAGMTNDNEAYGFYLSGLVELNGPRDIRSNALDYFKRAVVADPQFGEAWASIASIQIMLTMSSSDPRALIPEVRDAVAKALTADPSNVRAHVVLAQLHEYDYNWQQAETEYRTAVELGPNNEFARSNFASFLAVAGRRDEAFAEFAEVETRDPINRRRLLLNKAIVESQFRDFDAALETMRTAQAVEPTRAVQQFPIGYAYGGKGDMAEAANYYRRSIELLGGYGKYSQPLVYLVWTLAKTPGKETEARKLLERIESMPDYKSPALMALAYGALGERDKAFALLNQAAEIHDPLVRYVGGYEYDDLRGDPRFQSLLRQIKLNGN